MKGRKAKDKNIFILLAILLISSILLSSFAKNKTINKIEFNSLKPLDQEGQNYRLVTSADNVQVPVPKGYVASQITGENYVTPEYSHSTITHKVSTTPTELTWSSPEGEQYPWTQDENGIWISGNKNIPETESVLESEEFNYVKGTTVTINYTYSTVEPFEIIILNLTNNTEIMVVDMNGNYSPSFDYTTSNKTYTMNNWATGRYKIRAIHKSPISDLGITSQDTGYIKPSTYFKVDENGTQTIVEDIKTKIHDGGFVIYQLTDEEIETDPNGTNVVINDANKDTAQSTKNQYVWVPVANIEDIVRTKTINNGIMQFGQNYSFSNTSIIKETSTNSYREPRLVENYDKTKYYLQRYSNLDKRENYLNEQQDDFIKMIESINKYKGFYIGRYETGDEYTHSSSKKCFTNPKIVRYNSNIGYVTWYDSYKDLQRLSGKTEKYVETGMLYDSLWDYTLKWLNETDTRSYEEINKDSGTWGNYNNNTKTTQSGGTNPSRTGAIETIAYKGETYSDSPTASNNIFDIAGNLYEWTRSRYDTGGRRSRGGIYNDSSNSPAKYVINSDPKISGSIGVRGQLYIL